MLLQETKPSYQRFRRHDPAAVEHDPAASSATLRALAVRAHRLVRHMNETRSQPVPEIDQGSFFNLERELIELRSEIIQLDRRLQAQNLGGIAAYVVALRQKVDEALGYAPGTGAPARAALQMASV